MGESFSTEKKCFFATALELQGRPHKSPDAVVRANHSRGWHASWIYGSRVKKGARGVPSFSRRSIAPRGSVVDDGGTFQPAFTPPTSKMERSRIVGRFHIHVLAVLRKADVL